MTEGVHWKSQKSYCGHVASHQAIAVILLATAVLAGQSLAPPQFRDYQVRNIFQGRSAAPLLVRAEERSYRAMIREGVTNGWGATDAHSEESRPGPDFAGHYFIVRWPCGSPCMMAAIVDAVSGRVFPPPFHGSGDDYFRVPAFWSFPQDGPPILDYRVDSRLLIAEICEHSDQRCGTHYFEIGKAGLEEIRKSFRSSSSN